MTVLASCANFGGYWYDPIISILIEHVPWAYLWITGWIYSVGLIILTWDKLHKLQEKDKNE